MQARTCSSNQERREAHASYCRSYRGASLPRPATQRPPAKRDSPSSDEPEVPRHISGLRALGGLQLLSTSTYGRRCTQRRAFARDRTPARSRRVPSRQVDLGSGEEHHLPCGRPHPTRVPMTMDRFHGLTSHVRSVICPLQPYCCFRPPMLADSLRRSAQ
jgi:hypothetical protein